MTFRFFSGNAEGGNPVCEVPVFAVARRRDLPCSGSRCIWAISYSTFLYSHSKTSAPSRPWSAAAVSGTEAASSAAGTDNSSSSGQSVLPRAMPPPPCRRRPAAAAYLSRPRRNPLPLPSLFRFSVRQSPPFSRSSIAHHSRIKQLNRPSLSAERERERERETRCFNCERGHMKTLIRSILSERGAGSESDGEAARDFENIFASLSPSIQPLESNIPLRLTWHCTFAARLEKPVSSFPVLRPVRIPFRRPFLTNPDRVLGPGRSGIAQTCGKRFEVGKAIRFRVWNFPGTWEKAT